jgi:hypothetical protein
MTSEKNMNTIASNKLTINKSTKMKEVKRTYLFEREYTHGITWQPANVTCELEIDYGRSQWSIDNITAHVFNGSGWSTNLPKIKATIEMHAEVIEFAILELGDDAPQ